MKTLLPTLAGLALLAGLGTTPTLAETNLTLWMYGECTDNACIDKALIEGFEAANPDIKIDLISQPPDSYFTTLQASSAIGKGPDIATMWAGRYMTNFTSYMVDIHKFVPADIINSAAGAQDYSADNNTTGVVYAAPLAMQWYVGFYNKKLFADAGIDKVPTDWTELMDACTKLKAKGILPIINGGGPGEAQFEPLYEWSYIASAFPLAQWGDLIGGKMPYSNDTLKAQLTHWNELYTNGCLNEDAFNYQGAQDDFRAGKAAMMLGQGSWAITNTKAKLGDDLGILIPPYSDGPQKTIVALAGGGYAVTTYSQHQEEAGKFLNFVLSDAGQTIVAKFDAPTRAGFATNEPLINDLIAKTADTASYSSYPMFDNFSQPGVSDALHRNIALVLVGQATPDEALAAVDEAFAALPDDQKTAGFNFAGN
jgi:raffinose/stachyose/melibiose transport system substrate-binding protein